MKLLSVFIFNFVTLAVSYVWASHYSFDDKRQIYEKANKERTANNQVLAITDADWEALNGPSLVDKLNRLGDGTERATKLAASIIEFQRFVRQPTSEIENLKKRREIIESLQGNFDTLNPLISDLADLEHVFTQILDPQKAFLTQHYLYASFFQGSVVMTFSIFNVPYLARHFFYDWQTLKTSTVNRTWLCVMLLIKVAGAMGSVYKSGELIWDTGKKAIARVKEDDRFILDFAQAMRNIQEIITIIKEDKNQILANTLTLFIDFDEAPEKCPELKEILQAAEKRLDAEQGWYFSALWAAKNSPSLRDKIKSSLSREIFKKLYFAVARLDTYLAWVRIINDSKEKNIPTTFASFNIDTKRPYFCFTELRNPFITTCIPNDFELDGHAVLNGPSSGGKSAAGKAIIAAFITIQSTGGLVFAREAEIALVNIIGVHSNVGDNIDKGQSHFQAQAESIKRLLELAEANNDHGRTLLFIDEPNNGVTSRVGEIRMKKLLDKLVVFPSLTFLLTTHYQTPTEYEAQEGSVVQNWYPEIIEEGEYNKFKRTYIIKKGIAPWWYDDVTKANAFIEQISTE